MLRALQRNGLLLLLALRVVGGGAVALPQIRLRMTGLTLLPVPGMRLKVRILVALPGILTARLVLGPSRSSARVVLGQSGARFRPPRPSGVADVDSSSTFAGFRLAWGGLGGVFSRLWPLLVGREVRRSSSSRGSGPDSSTRFWALLYWGASAWFLPLG